MAPFKHLQIDMLGPLDITRNGNRFVIVMTDLFTRYTIAWPTKLSDAGLVAEGRIERCIAIRGAPVVLQSDRGSNFTSRVIDAVCKMLNTVQDFSSPHSPCRRTRASGALQPDTRGHDF
jgi:hypothetical protein